MATKNDLTPRTRIAEIIRAIVERPNHYTRKKLAELYGVSLDTIKGDFEAIETAGFVLQADEKHRYRFILDQPHKRLQDLLHFSEEDQAILYRAIDSLPNTTDRHQQLKRKLASLYDYSRLGHAYLRKPYLNKVDTLEQARKEKCQVVLEGYRSSNSNTISDRLVEPFHVVPSEDTLQAFDVEKNTLRHFRLSRFQRVLLTEAPWAFEGRHNILLTDPFRIVDNQQVNVHLRLSVGARNELEERYPLTRSFIEDTDDPNYFDFQCRVNHRFYGLSNFILGFHHLDIQVLAPDALLAHLRAEVARLKF